jgi:transposase-like protein
MARPNGKDGKRRVFSAEFKLEEVQRLQERRAAGISLSQIGPRAGSEAGHAARLGAASRGARGRGTPRRVPGPRAPGRRAGGTPRLQRENARLQQEFGFRKKAGAYFAKESR